MRQGAYLIAADAPKTYADGVMALLEILTYPDPRLAKKAKPVETVDDEI